MTVDVRCRTHRCRIAVIELDECGRGLVIDAAPETLAAGYTAMRTIVPWAGDGVVPEQLVYGCPKGHADRHGAQMWLTFARIRSAWLSGETLTWP